MVSRIETKVGIRDKANYVFGWDLAGAGAVIILAAFVMPGYRHTIP